MKGPLGKGLGLSCLSKGTHVAFAAGTGVLVFIDIVAKLLLQQQSLLKDEDKFNEDFKFVFYVSFMSRDEAIGLELMEGLHNLLRESGSDAFDLRLRLSKDPKQLAKPPRWDEAFVREQLNDLGKLEKLWVCGPPMMNEQFEDITQKLDAEG